MATSERMTKRFAWTGGKYQDLITKVIERNHNNVSRAIARVSKDNFEKGLSKIKNVEKRFIIPDVSDVLPEQKIILRKAAEKGKLIAKTLKQDLTDELKKVLQLETPKTAERRFITRRGKFAGRINQEVVTEFENKISEVFNSYTKKKTGIQIPLKYPYYCRNRSKICGQ